MEKQFKPVPDVECLKYHGTQDRPDIKIFVSHRIDLDSETIDNPLYIPVRCGAVFDEREDVTMLGDDTGDNISEKRLSFCEMTVQYWAWKNVKADYYGLCHYRRFFNFSKHKYLKDEYGVVLEEQLDADAEIIYGFREKTMRSVIERYDLIIPDSIRISSLPEHPKSMWEHWDQVKYLHLEDLQALLDVISRLQPEYYQSAQQYLDGDQAYFFNLCIMNSALFNRYCEWLFPILSELEQIIDIENYTAEGQRTIGHLAERLLGIYILYLRQNVRDIRIKELQPVLFRNTKKSVPSLRPAFNKELEDKIVPIVLSSSNVFAPACAVAIQSILYNASVEKFYDIVILESDISDKNKKLILSMVDGTDNISIRFIDVTPIIKNYTLVASEHLTVETYYRFLIQEILPEYGKILYLDGDLVCNRDVSELFCVDIEGYMLAAAYDPDVGGQINLKNSDTLSYLVHELKMEDPSSYFQAGVLLLNLKEMRSAYSLEQWLTFAGKRYRYCDQDVLNRYCQGRVKYIDMAWNVMIDCENRRVPVVIHEAKGEIYRQYHEARKHPYIVHFAGFQKPWKQRGVDFEEEFWKYARNTPYYEQFLFNITIPPAMPDNGLPAIGVKGALKIYIKKKTDIWFPKGTKRRTVIKRIFGRFVKN
ncbi:hypothetical protein N510_001297 [Firmicutes bacterium ASF500]|nr:hypothetical protein N510_001297 [Firmicutes bacterium ASF500]